MALVITEHDYQWNSSELAALAAKLPLRQSFPGPRYRRERGPFSGLGLPLRLGGSAAGHFSAQPARGGARTM